MNGFCALVLVVLGFEVYNSSLEALAWGHGLVRAAFLVGVVIFLFALRLWFAPVPQPSAAARRMIRWALVALLLANVGIAGHAIQKSFASKRIPLDQGETTWRSARLLWKGEDPYGPGALVDFEAYRTRFSEREKEGLGPRIPTREVPGTMAKYDKTLDPSLRRELLPVATGAEAEGLEARVLGYKYGPLLLEMTALAVPMGIPASVITLNVLATFALLYTLYRLMKFEVGPAFAELGVVALLLDLHISLNYLRYTATDVYPLLFCALAVFAYRSGRNLACGACLGLALACKTFPTLLLLPLLIEGGSLLAVIVFVLVTLAVWTPALLWDPHGVAINVFFWPEIMATDTTSWLFAMPKWAVSGIRVVVLAIIAMAWLRYLLGRETRLFWTLAFVSTVVLFAGNAFHFNYMPWASIWIPLTVLEAAKGEAATRSAIPAISSFFAKARWPIRDMAGAGQAFSAGALQR